MEYPFSSYSWQLITENIAIKKVDLSLISRNETGVPHEIVHFFLGSKILNLKEKHVFQCEIEDAETHIALALSAGNRHVIRALPITNDLQIGDSLVFERIGNNRFQLHFISQDYQASLEMLETERTIKARLKQNLFRKRVIEVCKHRCIVTDVKTVDILIASHIKSWVDSNDHQKVDGHNGLLLAPHIDKLFDRHLISFNQYGKIVTSNRLAQEVLMLWHINTNKTYDLTNQQLSYLEGHLENLSLMDSFSTKN